MSIFSRIWNFIRRPTGYVGKDLEENYFYEYAANSSDVRRTRRVVKYKGKTDMLEIANRNRQLAVQWKAWLTHTRLHPPTLEELHADLTRRQQVMRNAAIIDARDQEERLRFANTSKPAIDGPASASEVVLTSKGLDTPISTAPTARQQPPTSPAPRQESPWVPKPASDEPEAWSPRIVQRGA